MNSVHEKGVDYSGMYLAIAKQDENRRIVFDTEYQMTSEEAYGQEVTGQGVIVSCMALVFLPSEYLSTPVIYIFAVEGAVLSFIWQYLNPTQSGEDEGE